MAQLGCTTEKARDDIGKSVNNESLNVKSLPNVSRCCLGRLRRHLEIEVKREKGVNHWDNRSRRFLPG